jgi:hypothetical protein
MHFILQFFILELAVGHVATFVFVETNTYEETLTEQVLLTSFIEHSRFECRR